MVGLIEQIYPVRKSRRQSRKKIHYKEHGFLTGFTEK